MRRRVDRHWSASCAIDNPLDRQYFLVHRFPRRTSVADLTLGF